MDYWVGDSKHNLCIPLCMNWPIVLADLNLTLAEGFG